MPSRKVILSDSSARHRHKYANRSTLHQLSLRLFFQSIADILSAHKYDHVFEFGCGEGFFIERLADLNMVFSYMLGIDIREDAIADAVLRMPVYEFRATTLDVIEGEERRFDLVIASQVLEHLEDPESYLKRLLALSNKHVLLTVPHEPWFQLMNFIRGRDLRRFGNHPEHLQHWSAESFKSLVSAYGQIIDFRKPFPFLVALLGKRSV